MRLIVRCLSANALTGGSHCSAAGPGFSKNQGACTKPHETTTNCGRVVRGRDWDVSWCCVKSSGLSEVRLYEQTVRWTIRRVWKKDKSGRRPDGQTVIRNATNGTGIQRVEFLKVSREILAWFSSRRQVNPIDARVQMILDSHRVKKTTQNASPSMTSYVCWSFVRYRLHDLFS